MFTALAHKNLADAEKYFDEHLTQNDYYAPVKSALVSGLAWGGETFGAERKCQTRPISCALRKSESANR